MNTRIKQNVLLTEARDIPCLRFLWRWKMASTFSLCRKFYSDASIHTGYKRLLKLERAGFIQSRTDSTGSIYVWTLSQKGFQTIRHLLPPLKEEGYKSEHLIHDWLVSSIHLGDLLIQKSETVGLISEQELRRVDPEFFPSWVPTSTLHRPDGYTRIEMGAAGSSKMAKTIALEVELNLKVSHDYEVVSDFYSSQDVGQVIWVVPKQSAAERIHRVMEARNRETEMIHSFFLLDDVLKAGPKAKIILGKDENETLGKCLYQSVGSGLEQVPMQLLLNARKSPHKSKLSLTSRVCGLLQVS